MNNYTTADFLDLDSVQRLMSKLNYDFADAPVDIHSWGTQQAGAMLQARIIARKHDYQVFYVRTNSNSERLWKDISSRIIKENAGLCMVWIHNPNRLRWVFSSLSKNFTSTFSETRHIPIDLNTSDDDKLPKTFVEFLNALSIESDSNTTSIIAQVSSAFDLFAVRIGDELKSNVFDALKLLSEGIIFNKLNKMTLTEHTLEKVREPIFTLLYRIIFVLYADDQNIFPVDNDTYYKKFSLKWIKHKWLLNDIRPTTIPEYAIQKRLWGLFKLIESGSENMGYDQKTFYMKSHYGRLFDRKHHYELEHYKIKNQYLLQAIKLLTQTRDNDGNYFFLDYSALDTANLGSIYEGLLEYHLTIRDSQIAELPTRKDRKVSGSYYTPPYVVDYIVSNTIGPLIDNIVKNTDRPDEQVEKILKLNILDPAMGSGHFLVGVTNYIAKRICEIEHYGTISEQALVSRKRDVARQCIYGVDLNPLAVDLAHVSLWLETLSSEKPLSFLSAHLKTGNSLIGTTIDDVLGPQTTFMEHASGTSRLQFKKIIKDFIMIERLEDDSASAIKTKIEKYERIHSRGSMHYKLKLLLDAKVASKFGVLIPPLGDYISKIDENTLDFFADDAWPAVTEIKNKHSFFHWDLEFMDVFYDEKGNKKHNPGFDCVLGNPPYGAKLSQAEKNYYIDKFDMGTADTAQLMAVLAQNLLSKQGYNSFIVPKPLIFASKWKKIRTMLTPTMLILVDCKKVWKEVNLEQVIYVSQHDIVTDYYFSGFRKKNMLFANVKIDKSDCEKFGVLISGVTLSELLLGQKIHRMSKMLKPYVKSIRGSGLQNSVKPKGVLRCLGGSNIGRYCIAGAKGFLNTEDIDNDSAYVRKHSILVQNIVAHIENPIDHLKLTTTIPLDTDFTILDTISQLHINEIDPYYVLGLLNSKLMSWYTYRFIFAKAVRTMRFDNPVAQKIPIIQAREQEVTKRVKKLLRLNDEKTNCKNNPNAQIRAIESDLNNIFYEIFGLSDSEIKMIESTTPI